MRFCLSGLLLLIGSIPLFAQNPVTITLSAPDNGQKVYVAQDRVRLNPGYSYTGTSNAMRAYIEQHTAYQSLYNSAAFDAVSVNTALPVGVVEGSQGVSGAGGATYSIPVKLPYGTNGLTPQLSIEYNSLSGNGLLGRGWDLAGLSAISVVQSTWYQDNKTEGVSLNGTDRFALDGSRLHVTSGTYGANNSVYTTEGEQFLKITSYATGTGPDWFKVETKEGITMEFGNSANSRIKSKFSNAYISWRINKVYDTYGNYMEFIYRNENNDSRIDKILYTGNTNKGVIPYNIIQFVYETRNDVNTVYVSGTDLTSKTLLSKIVISSDGMAYKSYEFSYAQDDYSYLNAVTEVGSDGSKLNPTIFQYGSKGPAFQNVLSTVSQDSDNYIASTADYNGDGKQDILLYHHTYDANGVLIYTGWEVKISTGDNTFVHYASGEVPNGYILFFVDGIPHLNNPAIGSGFDFYGDGADDVLMVSYNIDVQDPNDPNDDLYTNARFIIQSIDGPDDLGFAYEPNIIPGGYLELDKFLKIGDFDGDGRDDILYSRYSSPSVVDYSGQMITAHSGVEVVGYTSSGLQYMHAANQSLTSDIDGDGKMELMLTYAGSCEAWEFNKNGSGVWLNTKILHSTDFSSSNRIVLGDFNGDRKTDILHFTAPTFRIGYSTGVGFNVKTLAANGNPSFVNAIGSYQHSNALIGDYNGDGISDLFCIYTNFVSSGGLIPNHTQVDVYHFLGFTPNGAPKVRIQTNTFPLHTAYNRIFPADYNGDARTELIVYKTAGSGSWHYSYDKNGEEYLLKRIKNGFGNVVSFDYRWMSKGDNYVKASGAAWPLNDVQFAMPLVYSASAPDGIGGSISETYTYEGAKFHRQGKGFLGFMKIVSTNAVTDVRSTKEFELNLSPHLLLLKKEKHHLAASNTLISEKTYTNQLTVTGVRYKLHVTGITENNALNTITKTTLLTFDSYGNNLQSTVTNGIETVVTQNTYMTFGGWWIPSRVATNTTTTTRSGETPYAKTSNYTYTSGGKLLTEVNYPSTPKTTTTTYVYDDFGNNTLKSVGSTGLSTVTIGATFDSKGRFAVRMRNPLNQETELEVDKRWGEVIRKTTPDELVETKVFDAFGRLKSSVNTMGIATTIDMKWDIADNGTFAPNLPQNTRYSVKKETAHKPFSKIWYDLLGRAVQEEVEELNGLARIVTNYTVSGQVKTRTSPFFTGNTPVYVSNSYDAYGRIISATNGAATTATSYAASGGQNTVTIANPAGTVVKTFDASGKIISSADDGGTLLFQYYSSGLQRQIMMSGVVLSSMEYDISGNQTKLIDSDGGINLYGYDAFGRLISQTDANGNHYQMTYDVMSRETSKSGPEGVTTTTYITTGYGLNNVKRVTSPNGVYIENEYDKYGQVTAQIESIDGVLHVMSKEYDYTYGRIKSMAYPSGYRVRFYYDSNSNLVSVKNDAGNVTVFSNPVRNAFGQYTQYTLGNGKITQKTYDEYGFPLITYANAIQNLETGFSQSTGNLLYRTDHLKNRSEEFDYDANNRLTESFVYNTVNGLVFPAIYVDYANNGNILEKTDAGVYEYDANKIHAVVGVDNPSGIIPSLQQDITYTPFDRTESISEGTKLLTFTYGPDLNRVKTVFTDAGTTLRTKYFFGGYEKEITPSYTREIHYIPTGEGSEAVYIVENGIGSYYYLYKDHLGSVVAVTNAAGTVVYEQNFDAWGRRRNATGWTHTSSTPPAAYSWVRGYTGHEHLEDFGLINMNNRLYDPVLGRMLAVDNYVSDPLLSQNYNRYSYVLNNPLKFTDPNGEFPWLVVASAVVLFTTDFGYDLQKLVSPVAVQLDLAFGSHTNGIGINISVGKPQIGLWSLRAEFGASYYFNRVGGYGSGWQVRYGAEWGLLWGWVRYGGLRYLDFGNGELLADQVVHTAKVGAPGFNLSYSNDTQNSFPWARFVPFLPELVESDFNASGSDRLRTASGNLRLFGIVNLGFFLHTGEAVEFNASMIDGNQTQYFDGGSINDPARRNGIWYIGVGGLKLGWDSEGVRHYLQNRVAHDHWKKMEQYGYIYPWVLKVDKTPRFVFQFGNF